jgi:CDP-diacylglycerol--glycerol-3-phosphate 3-phosphatidyltransferase
LRLAFLPLILYLSYGQTTSALMWAAVLFALCAAGDWLDGFLARRLDAKTRLGTFLDPAVDKVMVLSVLLVFADRDIVPLWPVLLLMLREFLVSGMRRALSERGDVVGANWMGKAKFCVQAAFVGLIYLQLILESMGRSLPGGRLFLYWCLAFVVALSFGFLLNFARWHRKELARSEGSTGGPREEA